MTEADSFPLGILQPVGQFCYHVHEDRWEWSEEMYRLHGFQPGEVVPTTELILRHKQRGEGDVGRPQVEEAVRSGKPHSFRHRIVDAHGRVRTVVTVWTGLRDPAGELVEVRGYMMDVSEGVRRDCTSAVAAAVEGRAVIDQAKGMLMLLHGLTEDAAFEVLRDSSCRTNTKLHLIAQRLVDALVHEGAGPRGDELAQVAAEILAGFEDDATSQQPGA
jgi:hypothetical protein